MRNRELLALKLTGASVHCPPSAGVDGASGIARSVESCARGDGGAGGCSTGVSGGTCDRSPSGGFDETGTEAQGVAVPAGAADSSEQALLLRSIRGVVPHT